MGKAQAFFTLHSVATRPSSGLPSSQGHGCLQSSRLSRTTSFSLVLMQPSLWLCTWQKPSSLLQKKRVISEKRNDTKVIRAYLPLGEESYLLHPVLSCLRGLLPTGGRAGQRAALRDSPTWSLQTQGSRGARLRGHCLQAACTRRLCRTCPTQPFS